MVTVTDFNDCFRLEVIFVTVAAARKHQAWSKTTLLYYSNSVTISPSKPTGFG